MINYLGNYALLSSLLVGIILLFIQNNYIIYTYNIQFILIFISFIGYLTSFLLNTSEVLSTHILLNSYSLLIYKIGAIWSSHEGSMLLWLFILSVYSLVLLNRDIALVKKNIIILKFNAFILICFILYIYISSNPFLDNQIYLLEDRLVNPILHDPLLVIHPPIIFLGYLCSIPIISNLLCMLNNQNQVHIKSMSSYSILGTFLLTIGIGLGSWWAYHELGWGGWWFWDPVENISLIPWITYVLLVHNISKYNRNKLFTSTIAHLSVCTFLFSCFGTFFVRSGLIVSIHSFVVDYSKGLLLLVYIVIIVSIYVYMYVKSRVIVHRINDLPLMIFNYIGLTFIILLISTLTAPVFTSIVKITEISFGDVFFNNMITYTILPILIGSIVISYKYIIQNLANLVIYSIVFIFFIKQYYIPLISAIYIYLCTLNIYIALYGMSLRSIYVNIIHSIFYLFIISIILYSMLEINVVTSLKIGESIKVYDNIVYFKDINYYRTQSYHSTCYNILIENSSETGNFSIEKRYYLYNDIVNSKSTIVSSSFNDLHLTLCNQINLNSIILNINHKPYINYIWVSFILIVLYIILYIYRHEILNAKRYIKKRIK